MAIEFRCTQCNQLLRVPEDAGGKSARCPKCQALMMVPATAPSPIAPPASPSSPAAPAPAPTSDSPFNILQQLPPPAPPPKPPADANPFGDAAGGGSPFGAAAPSLNPYASPGAAAIDTYYSQTQTFTGRPGLP